MDANLTLKAFETFIGPSGRMISPSKSRYREQFPYNITVFNANILLQQRGKNTCTKLWHGDLDLTKDILTLWEFCKTTETELYVLREMDARFENEKNPKIDAYVVRINKDFFEWAESLKPLISNSANGPIISY